MSHKATITLSMLWLGFLIAASRGWATNVRDYVRSTTGHEVTSSPQLTVLRGGSAGTGDGGGPNLAP